MRTLPFLAIACLLLFSCQPEEGCTDPTASNYNPEATEDDGSCIPLILNCGDPVSYQGYDYATVLIGEQCWFAENLRSENYNNGDEIPSNLSDWQWEATGMGATTVYGAGNSDCYSYSPDGDACDEAWSLNEYGRLYNWYAVDDFRGLCPSGWHVPSNGEWSVLYSSVSVLSEDPTHVELRTTFGWENGGNGTNLSGFSGLPGGGRSYDGSFDSAGEIGGWWGSVPNDGYAWAFGLSDDECGNSTAEWEVGLSVRCVQDF